MKKLKSTNLEELDDLSEVLPKKTIKKLRRQEERINKKLKKKLQEVYD